MKLFYRKLSVLILFLGGIHTSFAVSESSPFADGKNEDECRAEYDKSAGYKTLSPRQQDQASCKGVVGESFCLSDKEKAFIDRCKKSKKISTPAEPIEVKPLEADPHSPPEVEKPKSEEKNTGDNFQEM